MPSSPPPVLGDTEGSLSVATASVVAVFWVVFAIISATLQLVVFPEPAASKCQARLLDSITKYWFDLFQVSTSHWYWFPHSAVENYVQSETAIKMLRKSHVGIRAQSL